MERGRIGLLEGYLKDYQFKFTYTAIANRVIIFETGQQLKKLVGSLRHLTRVKKTTAETLKRTTTTSPQVENATVSLEHIYDYVEKGLDYLESIAKESNMLDKEKEEIALRGIFQLMGKQ